MKSKLFKTIGILSIIVLFGKALGLFREVLISFRFGAGYVSDVYVFEDGFINMLNSIFISIVSTTFIPIYIKLEKEEKSKYINNIFGTFGMVLLFGIILCEIFTVPILKIFVPGFFDIYNMTEIVLVTRIMLLTVLFVFFENVLMAVFQANEYYYFSSLQSIILNFSLLLYLIFGFKFGIYGIIITKIISHLFILLILYFFIFKKKIFKPGFVINPFDENIKKMIKLSLPVLLVSAISQLNYIVDRIMSSMLSSGSMTLINFSTTITMLPYYVIGYAVNSTFFTEVSKVQDDRKKISDVLNKHLSYLNKIIIPACIILFLFATEIGYIMYGRGNMTESNIQIIGGLIVLYVPGIYLLCVRDLLNRVCYAVQKTYLMSISTMVGFIINIGLNILLVKIFGIYGLAMATSIGSLISTVLIYIFLIKKKIITLDFKLNFGMLFKYILPVLLILLFKYSFHLIIFNKLITYILMVCISFIFIFCYINYKDIKEVFRK